MLEARIPSGPIEQQWDTCRYEMKLVNPANRRKHSIIVVGAGLAGAAAAATLGQQGYRGRIAPRGAARAQVPRSAARRVPISGWAA
jgi:shikimate 5-dehydrogenase